MRQRNLTSPRDGFTLIEAMVATAIVGMGVSAMMMASQSGTRVNADSQERTRAVFLAQETREWIATLPFASLTTGMKSLTYSPPHDGQGTEISTMSDWAQHITLTWVNPSNFSAAVADGTSNVIKVRVAVLRHDKTVLTTTWIVTKGSAQ